ncbi:MAG: ABC transporter ATP-binding protein [Synergistales bacterium]
MLAAVGLSAGYGDEPVIRELSLTVRPGEVLALLGPNGSGKSTLLSALCGVVKTAGGEVLLDGRPLLRMNRRSVSRKIAYVPQQSVFTQGFRVEEIVLMGRSCWLGPFERPKEDDLRRVERALEAMELQQVRGKPVTELSGGESQRACLARALAQDTPICLFDEPTASLDPRHALLVMEQLARLAREGKGVVVALHDVNLAFRYSARMAFLRGGRLLGEFLPEEVDGRILESVFDVRWTFAEGLGKGRRAFPA